MKFFLFSLVAAFALSACTEERELRYPPYAQAHDRAARGQIGEALGLHEHRQCDARQKNCPNAMHALGRYDYAPSDYPKECHVLDPHTGKYVFLAASCGRSGHK